jgi:hypothetical protein
MGIKRYSAGVMLALAACATTTSTPSIYYKTQAEADVVFEAYGRANPTCSAWTDWKTTCSRISSDGTKLHCNTTKVITERSPIFCLASAEFGKQFGTLKEYQSAKKAYRRYCEFYSPRLEDSKNRIVGECTVRDQKRPFGGYEISELRHPYCEKWREGDKEFCTERDDDNSLPSCKSMEGVRSKYLLECSVQNSQKMSADGCLSLGGPIAGRYDGIEITNHGAPNFTVTQEGLECGRWRK